MAEQDDLVEGVASEAADAKIVTIISADAGWRAVYGSASGSEELSRIIAWALVEDAGTRRVVGLVVDPQDRTNIVPATDSQASQAGPLSRYGFKDR